TAAAASAAWSISDGGIGTRSVLIPSFSVPSVWKNVSTGNVDDATVSTFVLWQPSAFASCANALYQTGAPPTIGNDSLLSSSGPLPGFVPTIGTPAATTGGAHESPAPEFPPTTATYPPLATFLPHASPPAGVYWSSQEKSVSLCRLPSEVRTPRSLT